MKQFGIQAALLITTYTTIVLIRIATFWLLGYEPESCNDLLIMSFAQFIPYSIGVIFLYNYHKKK